MISNFDISTITLILLTKNKSKWRHLRRLIMYLHNNYTIFSFFFFFCKTTIPSFPVWKRIFPYLMYLPKALFVIFFSKSLYSLEHLLLISVKWISFQFRNLKICFIWDFGVYIYHELGTLYKKKLYQCFLLKLEWNPQICLKKEWNLQFLW